MTQDKGNISVYYCAYPKCIKDRLIYEKHAVKEGYNVCRIDITGQEQKLCELDIDPVKALTQLHFKDENESGFSEMDGYFVNG